MSAPVLVNGDPVTLSTEDGTPYLAVDVSPDGTGDTFTLDLSELDGPDLLAWGADDGQWVNIVCDVTAVSTRRGASRLQGVLTRAEAGTATISLEDPQRSFDPLVNGDVIHRGTPFRLRGWGFLDGGAGDRWDAVVFTGKVDELGVIYPAEPNLPPRVTITAYDVVAPLVGWRAAGREQPGVGAGDDLLERAQRIVAEVGAPVDLSPDSDQVYTATLPATTLGANAWDGLLDAAEAELGRVWVDVQDRVVLRARGSELTGPVRGTLSDVHGEASLGVHCCYTDPQVTLGSGLANGAVVTRRVSQDPAQPNRPTSATVSVHDPASEARYGPQTVERTLELENDDQLMAWAQEVVTTWGTPQLRVEQVSPAPWNNPEAWPAVLATDVGDRWLYRQHPAVGPPVQLALGVLGVEHDVTPERWRVTWHTARAPEPGVDNPAGYFLLDSSLLDGEDVLTPPLAVAATPGVIAPGQGPRVIDGGAP